MLIKPEIILTPNHLSSFFGDQIKSHNQKELFEALVKVFSPEYPTEEIKTIYKKYFENHDEFKLDLTVQFLVNSIFKHPLMVLTKENIYLFENDIYYSYNINDVPVAILNNGAIYPAPNVVEQICQNNYTTWVSKGWKVLSLADYPMDEEYRKMLQNNQVKIKIEQPKVPELTEEWKEMVRDMANRVISDDESDVQPIKHVAHLINVEKLEFPKVAIAKEGNPEKANVKQPNMVFPKMANDNKLKHVPTKWPTVTPGRIKKMHQKKFKPTVNSIKKGKFTLQHVKSKKVLRIYQLDQTIMETKFTSLYDNPINLISEKNGYRASQTIQNRHKFEKDHLKKTKRKYHYHSEWNRPLLDIPVYDWIMDEFNVNLLIVTPYRSYLLLNESQKDAPLFPIFTHKETKLLKSSTSCYQLQEQLNGGINTFQVKNEVGEYRFFSFKQHSNSESTSKSEDSSTSEEITFEELAQNPMSEKLYAKKMIQAVTHRERRLQQKEKLLKKQEEEQNEREQQLQALEKIPSGYNLEELIKADFPSKKYNGMLIRSIRERMQKLNIKEELLKNQRSLFQKKEKQHKLLQAICRHDGKNELFPIIFNQTLYCLNHVANENISQEQFKWILNRTYQLYSELNNDLPVWEDYEFGLRMYQLLMNHTKKGFHFGNHFIQTLFPYGYNSICSAYPTVEEIKKTGLTYDETEYDLQERLKMAEEEVYTLASKYRKKSSQLDASMKAIDRLRQMVSSEQKLRIKIGDQYHDLKKDYMVERQARIQLINRQVGMITLDKATQNLNELSAKFDQAKKENDKINAQYKAEAEKEKQLNETRMTHFINTVEKTRMEANKYKRAYLNLKNDMAELMKQREAELRAELKQEILQEFVERLEDKFA